MTIPRTSPPSLPIRHSLAIPYGLSLVIAALTAAVSVAGLLFPAVIYPTEELHRAFASNDVVNLLIGLPLLLGSLAAAWRGRLLGLLFWPGALFYVTYNALAYTVALPFSGPFVANLILALVSAYTIYRLLSAVDAAAVREQLAGKVHERVAGGVLIGLGALFFLRGIGQLVQAAAAGPELAVVIADLLTTPFWVIGGILLWRKRAWGYVSGAGLLFQGSMLFVGLLIFFILQPFVAGVPFPVGDFAVIAAMSLVCLIPFGLFLRGATARR